MRTNYFNHLLHKELGHFTVIDGNKTGVDLVLIKHFLLSYGNLVDLILTSILQALCRILFFLTKEVCIKTGSTATSDHIHSTAWLVPRESNYFTFCGGRELKTTTFVFFSWSWPNFDTVFSEFNSREKYEHLTNWTRWNNRISEIKFEAARIHFFRDASVAVTVVVAYKLPGMSVHMWYLRKKKKTTYSYTSRLEHS